MSDSRKNKKHLAIIRDKIDFTFVLDGSYEMEFSIYYLGDKVSRLGRLGFAAPNKLTLREILHLYFSETVYYGRMSCRCAKAACPLRMLIPCLMLVRQRGPVRPVSPGCRFRVDPSALRLRAGTTPPFTDRRK